MSKYFPIFITGLAAVFCSVYAQDDNNNNSNQNNNQQQSDSSDNDTEVYWIGPGIYYGLWFATEAEFLAWRRDHVFYHHHYHYDHDHYHDHDRDHRGDRGRADRGGNVHQHYHSSRGGGHRGGGRRGGGRR